MSRLPPAGMVRQGFTFIELLVVVAIIGLLSSVVGYNMFVDDPGREVRREAERFVLAMTQAVDHASFRQIQLGLYSDEASYHFGYWSVTDAASEEDSATANAVDPTMTAEDSGTSASAVSSPTRPAERETKWLPLTTERSLQVHSLPERMQIMIELEPATLLDTETQQPESRLTQTNLDLDNIGPKVEEEPGLEPPLAFILSSGEMTPFLARFTNREDATLEVVVEADELGRIRLREADEF